MVIWCLTPSEHYGYIRAMGVNGTETEAGNLVGDTSLDR